MSTRHRQALPAGLVAALLAAGPPADALDHFKCYKVKDLKNPPFMRVAIPIADQFKISTADVKKPSLLCLAADKNGEGVGDAAGLLTCYRMKDAPPLLPVERPQVRVENQFGAIDLEATKEYALCVVSTPAGLSRAADPVVLTGADVPALIGIPPGDMVAFRYFGGWAQIPVQVDERDVIDYDDVYDDVGTFGGGITGLNYTDAGTFTGPDSDASLDGDDELVFMAKDAGNAAPAAGLPGGVVPGSGVEVVVTDPAGSGIGHVYLFRRLAPLDPGAGRPYVSYQFQLLSGSYLATYDVADGPNPEDSTVTTAYYARHFTDRWIQDGLRILARPASGADILDRHKFLFTPGFCGRSEDTFSNAEGAFIVNKSGPVRAIRAYVGANSGPLTERLHAYYERREDITTHLRVHPVTGGIDFFDYGAASAGMTYRNNNNPAGVTIDGGPDLVAAGLIEWELVDGSQGSLIMVSGALTDIAGLAPTSYYQDDATPPDVQCTGDAFTYGASGPRIVQSLPNTDPRNPPFNWLTATRVIYYGPPGATVADATQHATWAAQPLAYATSPWP